MWTTLPIHGGKRRQHTEPRHGTARLDVLGPSQFTSLLLSYGERAILGVSLAQALVFHDDVACGAPQGPSLIFPQRSPVQFEARSLEMPQPRSFAGRQGEQRTGSLCMLARFRNIVHFRTGVPAPTSSSGRIFTTSGSR